MKIFDPTTLFKLDAGGALLTAAMHAFVLTKFDSIFGIPNNILISLAIIGLCYAIYSTLCAIRKPKNWRLYLRIIAYANLLFCLLTIIIMFLYNKEILLLGKLYLIGEIFIISFIVSIELQTAKRYKEVS